MRTTWPGSKPDTRRPRRATICSSPRREARYLANHPSATNPTTRSNPPGTPPANLAPPSSRSTRKFEAYESSGASGPFRTTGLNGLVINGTSVGIQVKAQNTGDFTTFVSTLQSDGMQVLDSSSTYGLVDGMLPIAQLPTVAQLPQTQSVMPMFNPILSSSPTLD